MAAVFKTPKYSHWKWWRLGYL